MAQDSSSSMTAVATMTLSAIPSNVVPDEDEHQSPSSSFYDPRNPKEPLAWQQPRDTNHNNSNNNTENHQLTTTTKTNTSSGRTVIGSPHLPNGQCPCCRQSLLDKNNKNTTTKDKINEPTVLVVARDKEALKNRNKSLLDNDNDDDTDNEEEDTLHGEDLIEDLDEKGGGGGQAARAGILAAGVSYTVSRVLVEGWLHKKGTGQDWLGSRAWKARWGRLLMAKVGDANDDDSSNNVEVPLLVMYWYPSSVKPSTVILLESTVVVAVDQNSTTMKHSHALNAHRFEIRHATGQWSGDDKAGVTRTFSAGNPKERDQWVYAIAQALLDHAKCKQAAHKNNNAAMAAAVSEGRGRSPFRRSVAAAVEDSFCITTTSGECRSLSPPPRYSHHLNNNHQQHRRPISPPPSGLPRSPRSMPTRKVVVGVDSS